jgi:hypothetical protein
MPYEFYDTIGPADAEQAVSVAKLNKDLREAAETMTDKQARFLVDAYYAAQKERTAQGRRVGAMQEEPHGVLEWLGDQQLVLEKQVLAALGRYTKRHKMGSWMREIHGIGPVISAGFLAHIDIHKAPTVGHIWRFAGLDPTLKWEKGEKRPYNAGLKQICYHAGESFKRFSASDKCYYGKLYRQRKAYEVDRNESGGNADTAAETLRSRKIGDAATRTVYESGKLPAGRLDLRSTRWAVKQMLADMHGEWYRRELGREPPKPYPIAILHHAHLREAPQKEPVSK